MKRGWMRAGVAASAFAVLMSAGCGGAERREKAEPLEVFCGAGLRPPIAALAERYEAETGIPVQVTYGASNLLLGQLKVAQRGDIFIPGDAFYVEAAVREGLADEAVRVAGFEPVLLVARGNPLSIASVVDLVRPGVRLALGDPRAPAIGRVSMAVFEKNGVAAGDVARNTVFSGTTVHEVAEAVRLGHADAALVWNAVATAYAPACEWIPIPEARNVSVPVEAAVLRTTRRPDSARAFVERLAGPEGQAVFRAHGYGP